MFCFGKRGIIFEDAPIFSVEMPRFRDEDRFVYNGLVRRWSESEPMKIAKLIEEFRLNVAEEMKQKPYYAATAFFSEYLEKVSTQSGVEPEIAEALTIMVDNPCHKDSTLWIWAAQYHPSELYFQPLYGLLKQYNNCIWYEGIVDIFPGKWKAEAIPYLEAAIHYDLSYDPGQAAAIRILEELVDIGTPEAIEVLKNCLDSPSERIREYAQLFLGDDR